MRRDRLVVASSLVGVTALAWLYLWHQAATMDSETGMAMTMPSMGPGAFVLTFAMWVVMMAGMMLPSAAPTILMYGAMVRKRGEGDRVLPAAWIFVAGYLLMWTGFSLGATLLQAALERAALLDDMMTSASRGMNGAVLLAAGVYQWTPLKDACLGKCRNPIQFFMTHWRPGAAGALRMGVANGAYCVGCCWVLMLLLFAVGVMNLAWVAIITAFVFIEKLLPAGRLTSRLSGSGLIAVGLVYLMAA